MISSQQMLGLDTGHLVSLDEHHALVPEARDAFSRMQGAAKVEGIDLQLVSSFRSFERQKAIWNKKWQGLLPLNTIENTQLDAATLNKVEKLHAIMLWSALPGASRHHWGTDIDVFDKAAVQIWEKTQHGKFQLVPNEYKTGGPCEALNIWLTKNAASFGFFRPYENYVGGVAAEPWHLSFEPIAQTVINYFSLDELKNALEQHSVYGLDTITANLPTIFKRYTLNAGLESEQN